MQLISCLQTSTQSAHFFTHTSIWPISSSSHKYPQFSTEEGKKRKKNLKKTETTKTPHKNILLKAYCSLLLLLLAPWRCQVQRSRRLVVQSPLMIATNKHGPKKLLTATLKVMNPETSVKALNCYCSFQRKKKRKTTKVASAEANGDTKGWIENTKEKRRFAGLVLKRAKMRTFVINDH
jgi:hypothetical protein